MHPHCKLKRTCRGSGFSISALITEPPFTSSPGNMSTYIPSHLSLFTYINENTVRWLPAKFNLHGVHKHAACNVYANTQHAVHKHAAQTFSISWLVLVREGRSENLARIAWSKRLTGKGVSVQASLSASRRTSLVLFLRHTSTTLSDSLSESILSELEPQLN